PEAIPVIPRRGSGPWRAIGIIRAVITAHRAMAATRANLRHRPGMGRLEAVDLSLADDKITTVDGKAIAPTIIIDRDIFSLCRLEPMDHVTASPQDRPGIIALDIHGADDAAV